MASNLDIAKSKMGLSGLTNDLAGLKTFYRAWCEQVPFDNILKTTVVFGNPQESLPFTEPEEFFASWSSHGTGATCWPHSKAIWALARSCGFDARLAAGSMFDMGPANHATVIVHLPDGSQWLLDNAFLTLEPLRLDRQNPGRVEEGANFAEVEYDGDQIYVHGTHPPMSGIFFRLLETDVPEAFYTGQWNELAGIGPFNSCLHIRKDIDGEIATLRGNMLFRQDSSGVRMETLDSAGIAKHLKETFGISDDLIKKWSDSGALAASASYEAQMPPLPVRVPPSKR